MARPGFSGLRVLQVMECTIGGTRRHLNDLASGLNAVGVEVHLVVAVERQADFAEDLERLKAEGCTVHLLPMRRSISPLSDAQHLLALRKLLLELQPDIVHTHSSKAGVLGRLASYLTGIGKRVHTPHTLAFLFGEMFGPIKRGLFYQFEKQLAGMSHALVAVSQSEARTFASSGIVTADKVHVVPNGIDPRPYAKGASASLEELGLDPSQPCAAVVGLLNVAKGQDLAIQAIALRPELSDLQLLIVGHGELDKDLKALAEELGVAQRVAFVGFRRDVPDLLRAVGFLLLPSRWEGMPYIVLEAMAAGLPVVATPVDGALDLIVAGENGWLAESINAHSIASVLTQVVALSPSELAFAGENARRLVLKDFTHESMVAGLLDLYASLLGGEPQ